VYRIVTVSSINFNTISILVKLNVNAEKFIAYNFISCKLIIII